MITNNEAGEPIQITINLHQHPEVIPALKEIGLFPKTQFDIDFESGMTLDEFSDSLNSVIKEHFESNKKDKLENP